MSGSRDTSPEVTLLFTDVEKSTEMIEAVPAAYADALAQHNQLLREICSRNGGEEFHDAGDGLYFAFSESAAAVEAASKVQRALQRHQWPDPRVTLRVRMALHLCRCHFRDGQYRGPGMHVNSRLLSAGHGGQILCSSMIRDAVPDAAYTTLGTFRLRGLGASHAIHQIDWSPERPAFPPLRAAHVRRHNLPALADTFIGRNAETHWLRERLRRSTGGSLVTIEGPGGTGKTRLALETARSLLDEMDHAVAHVPLAACSDAALLPRALADALGCISTAGSDPLEDAVAKLSGYPCLLLLDNLEHLGEAGAHFVGSLLRRLPDCLFLVTSRRALGLHAERILTLGNLPLEPDPSGLSEAARLLITRVRARLPDFELDDSNRDRVEEICRWLGGIPLALELAAARMELLDPTALLDSLSAAAGEESASRLDQVIGWSVDHLPPDTRRVFVQLGIFRGGVTAAAAREVCEIATPEQTFGHLHFLHHVRLLGPGGTGRYLLPEPIRQHAQHLIEDEVERGARRRQMQFLIAAARRTDALLGTERERAAVDEIALEMDNVVDALQHGHDLADRTRLVLACHDFALSRGLAPVLRPFLPEGEGADYQSLELKLEALAWHAAGMIDLEHRSLAEAAHEFQTAVRLFQKLGEDRHAIAARNNLAIIAEMQGQYAEASACYREIVAYYREAGMPTEHVVSLLNMGTCESQLGSGVEALAIAEEVLALREKHELPEGFLAPALQIVSDIQLRAGQLPAARRSGEESLEIAQRLGRPPQIVRSLINLADIDGGEEKWAAVLDRCESARAAARTARITLQEEEESRLRRFEKNARKALSSVEHAESYSTP